MVVTGASPASAWPPPRSWRGAASNVVLVGRDAGPAGRARPSGYGRRRRRRRRRGVPVRFRRSRRGARARRRAAATVSAHRRAGQQRRRRASAGAQPPWTVSSRRSRPTTWPDSCSATSCASSCGAAGSSTPPRPRTRRAGSTRPTCAAPARRSWRAVRRGQAGQHPVRGGGGAALAGHPVGALPPGRRADPVRRRHRGEPDDEGDAVREDPGAGADTLVWLVATPRPQLVSGGYYEKRKLIRPNAQNEDARLAAQLWDASMAAVGF